MTSELATTRKQLMALGIVQLVTYVAIGLAIYYEGFASDSGNPLAIGPIGLNAYLMGTVTLIPSAVIFILEARRPNVSGLRLARGLQITLFIAVCVAFVPALMLASFSHHAWLVIACVLGVIYFPFMTALVRKLIPTAVPVNAPEPEPTSEQTKATPVSLENAKFCPTCGSVVGADGRCPNCA